MPIQFFCTRCTRYISKRHVIVGRSLSGSAAYYCPACQHTLHIEGLFTKRTLFAVGAMFLLCLLAFLVGSPSLTSPITIRPGELFYEYDGSPIIRYYYEGVTDSHVIVTIVTFGSHTRGRFEWKSTDASALIDITRQQFQIMDRMFHIDAFRPITQEVVLSWT